MLTEILTVRLISHLPHDGEVEIAIKGLVVRPVFVFFGH
jgi:hypothetical protein